MPNNTITFQLATHMISRAALRIESLMELIRQSCAETNPTLHLYAIKHLIELIDFIEKPELKSRFLKELIRIEYVLSKAHSSMNQGLMDDVSTQIYALSHSSGAFSLDLLDVAFLKTVRQVYQSNTKDCEFHSPQLKLWLDLPIERRLKDLNGWLKKLEDLQQTVSVYLTLLRETSFYTRIKTEKGFYQYTLPPKATCHLVACKMDKAFHLVPKLQVGYHGLTIRLFDFFTQQEANDASVEIDIAICQL